MPPTLREIRERRKQRRFVAREEELNLFRENLSLELDDEHRRFVLNVFGQGGVGKTKLLEAYRRLAHEAGWLTACIDQVKEGLPEVMHRLATELGADMRSFKNFNERYERFLRNREALEADPEYVEGFAGLAGSVISRAGVLLARRTPVAGGLLDEVDVDTVGDKGRELGALLARKFKSEKKDVQLMRDPITVLTPLFLEGLAAVANADSVALFFDEYELTSRHLDEWLRDLLDGRHGDVPGNSLLVIAGRNELDRNAWAPFGDLTARLSLEPFAEEEAKNYLAGHGIHSQEVVDLILKLSGRLPLLLATLAAGEPTDVAAVGEASDTAVDRFLSWVEESERKELAIDAAAPRLINRDIITELVNFSGSAGDAEALFDWLIKMPFIVQRSNGWTYHDVVRQQMLRHARRRSPDRCRKLQEWLGDAFARRRDELGLGNEEKERQSADRELLHFEHAYHRLCVAHTQQFPKAVSGLLKALLKRKRSAVRRWSAVVCDAGRDSETGFLETWGKDLSELTSDALTRERRVEILGRIVDQVEIPVEDLSIALEVRVLTYWQMQLYQEALRDSDRILAQLSCLPAEATPDEVVSRTLLFKGLILGALERSDEAIAVYDLIDERYGSRDEAAIAEQVAGALFNKGVTLGELERSDEAIAVYDLIDHRYGSSDEVEIAEQVAGALFNKGFRLGALGRSDEEIAVYDLIDQRYGKRDAVAIAEQVAQALFNKGFRLGELGRSDEEIAVYDLIDQRYGSRDAVAIAEQVARALFNKGFRLGELGRSDEEIAVYDLIDQRYGSQVEVPIARQVAQALVDKGLRLEELERSDEAIAVYDLIDQRYASRDEVEIAKQVTQALINKGFALGALERRDEEIAVYDLIDQRYGSRDAVSIAEQVAQALFNKGFTLEELGRSDEAIAVYALIDQRYGSRDEAPIVEAVAETFTNASLLHMGRGSRAEPGSAEQERHWTRANENLVRYAERTGRDLERIYNFACLQALRGRATEALASLEACLEDEEISIEYVLKDSDWSQVKSRPEFIALVERFSKKQAF